MSNYVSAIKMQLNSIISVIMLICSFAVSFWLIPVFIKNLGPELFGIWLISGVIAGQLGFCDLGLTAGISRQMAIEFARNHMREVSICVWWLFTFIDMCRFTGRFYCIFR